MKLIFENLIVRPANYEIRHLSWYPKVQGPTLKRIVIQMNLVYVLLL